MVGLAILLVDTSLPIRSRLLLVPKQGKFYEIKTGEVFKRGPYADHVVLWDAHLSICTSIYRHRHLTLAA